MTPIAKAFNEFVLETHEVSLTVDLRPDHPWGSAKRQFESFKRLRAKLFGKLHDTDLRDQATQTR